MREWSKGGSKGGSKMRGKEKKEVRGEKEEGGKSLKKGRKNG